MVKILYLPGNTSIDTECTNALREVCVVQAPHLLAIKQQVVDGQVHIAESVILSAPSTPKAVGARPKVRDQLKQPPLQPLLPQRLLPPRLRL